MIICVCRRISDRDVKLAVADGARGAAQVFAAMQTQPQCGQCEPLMDTMIEDLSEGAPISAAAE